jgi:WD40 repeat protein
MTEHSRSHQITNLQAEADEQLRSSTLFQRAMRRVAHDYLTLTALGVVTFLALASFAAPLIVSLFLDIDYNNPDLYNSKLPPGSHVADSNTTVWQWITTSGESRRPFIGHTNSVIDLSFHPTEPIFVTASEDGTVRVWHIPSGRTQRKLDPPRNSDIRYTAADLNANGNLLLTGTNRGGITVWERDKANPQSADVSLVMIEAEPATITSVAFSPDDTLLLSGGDNGQVQLWDSSTGTLIHTATHSNRIHEVAFKADNALYAAADADGFVIVRETATNEVVFTLEHGAAARSVAFSPDGDFIATGGEDNVAILWNPDGSPAHILEHASAVNSVAFTPDGNLLTGTGDGDAFLWDVTTGEIIQSYTDFDYPINKVRISPDGESLITATAGRERYYVLGTDTSGRDHLSRLFYAGQISLNIGFLGGWGALTGGGGVGVLSG